MFFRDSIESKAQWAEYVKVLAQISRFLDDCVTYLKDAYDVAAGKGADDGGMHHVTVNLLTLHVCEFVDGVSVLAKKGCAQACKPLLRSAFEALISVLYILQDDTERRALAYQIAHQKKKIKLCRSMMSEEQTCEDSQRKTQAGPLGLRIRLPRTDYQAMIDDLEQSFRRPEYAPIEQAWEAAKKQQSSRPHWFSLFGGPRNIELLASKVGCAQRYGILYRHWSEAVHAEGALDHIARSSNGTIVQRPLRHPEELQPGAAVAGGICISLARRLVEYYDYQQMRRFQATYTRKLRERMRMLTSKRRMINAPWK